MKRFVLKLVLFLLLGAIINVAVAWGLAAFRPLPTRVYTVVLRDGLDWPSGLPSFFPSRPSYCADIRGWGFTRRDILARRLTARDLLVHRLVLQRQREELQAEESNAGEAEALRRDAEFNAGEAEVLRRDFARQEEFLDHVEVGEPGDYRAAVITTGWPYCCLQGTRWSKDVTDQTLNVEGLARAIEISVNPLIHSYDGWSTTEKRMLPCDVRWPGFAINTIFYAAILWLPFAALGALRRRRRIKRGLCAKCGYDLRGSTSQSCPECGKAIAMSDSRKPTSESP